MINPTGKKLEKLLFGIFDDAIEGIDRYIHNGSLWLIFTDKMRWVVEYTKEQTLWYNYSFFKNEMELVGLDCVENKDLIQKWFESRFLNMGEVQFADYIGHPHRNVYDTIQNGVKETLSTAGKPLRVEDTIQNGVKQTELSKRDFFPEDIFQNGVKNTENFKHERIYSVEDTIQNGVKHTNLGANPAIAQVEDIIQNGVKETYKSESTKSISLRWAIQNGVKHIENLPTNNPARIEDAIQNGVKHCEDGDRLDGDERFEDIIQNGVKEMQPLPAQDGNRDWGKYYHGKEDRTKPHTEYVKDVIKIGEKLNQDGI